jgi:hypothetical protein
MFYMTCGRFWEDSKVMLMVTWQIFQINKFLQSLNFLSKLFMFLSQIYIILLPTYFVCTPIKQITFHFQKQFHSDQSNTIRWSLDSNWFQSMHKRHCSLSIMDQSHHVCFNLTNTVMFIFNCNQPQNVPSQSWLIMPGFLSLITKHPCLRIHGQSCHRIEEKNLLIQNKLTPKNSSAEW